MRALSSAFLLLVWLLSGCQTGSGTGGGASRTARTAPQLPPATAAAAGFSEEEARLAASLCDVKCVRCHKFYSPADYAEPEWNTWMTKMSRKARLKPDQEKLLARYLGALRTEGGDREQNATGRGR